MFEFLATVHVGSLISVNAAFNNVLGSSELLNSQGVGS